MDNRSVECSEIVATSDGVDKNAGLRLLREKRNESRTGGNETLVREGEDPQGGGVCL